MKRISFFASLFQFHAFLFLIAFFLPACMTGGDPGLQLTYQATHQKGAPPLRPQNLSISNDHGCLVVEGRLYCWGENTSGQLGLGNNTAVSIPTRVHGAWEADKGRVNAVAVSPNHTCALVEIPGANQETVWCWGAADSGQVKGDGSTTPPSYSSPKQVLGGLAPFEKGSKRLAAFEGASCVISSETDGTQCWGRWVPHGEAENLTLSARVVCSVPGDGVNTVLIRQEPKAVLGVGSKTNNCYGIKNQLFCSGYQDPKQRQLGYSRFQIPGSKKDFEKIASVDVFAIKVGKAEGLAGLVGTVVGAGHALVSMKAEVQDFSQTFKATASLSAMSPTLNIPASTLDLGFFNYDPDFGLRKLMKKSFVDGFGNETRCTSDVKNRFGEVKSVSYREMIYQVIEGLRVKDPSLQVENLVGGSGYTCVGGIQDRLYCAGSGLWHLGGFNSYLGKDWLEGLAKQIVNTALTCGKLVYKNSQHFSTLSTGGTMGIGSKPVFINDSATQLFRDQLQVSLQSVWQNQWLYYPTPFSVSAQNVYGGEDFICIRRPDGVRDFHCLGKDYGQIKNSVSHYSMFTETDWLPRDGNEVVQFAAGGRNACALLGTTDPKAPQLRCRGQKDWGRSHESSFEGANRPWLH